MMEQPESIESLTAELTRCRLELYLALRFIESFCDMYRGYKITNTTNQDATGWLYEMGTEILTDVLLRATGGDDGTRID